MRYPGRADGGRGPVLAAAHVVGAEEAEGGQDHPADDALHGRGRHPGRPQGNHVGGHAALLRLIALPQEQIRSRLPHDHGPQGDRSSLEESALKSAVVFSAITLNE